LEKVIAATQKKKKEGEFHINEKDVETQEGYGIKKQELVIKDVIEKENLNNYDTNIRYDYKTLTACEKFLNSDFLEYNFNEEEEKNKVVTSIEAFVSKYEQEFPFWNNLEPSILQKNIISLGKAILKDLIIHLGIAEKNYEVYDYLVTIFFDTYLNFYDTVFGEVIKNIKGNKYLYQTFKHIKALLRFDKNSIVNFKVNPFAVNDNVNFSNNFYLDLKNKPNQKNMLFLRNQFITNEEKFFGIMNLIEFHIWVYPGLKFK
jgi:hypothetical protein